MANKLINSLASTNGSDVGVFGLPYGECSTTADTAAKTVTVQGDFALEKGAMVAIKFTYTNAVANPTLNVNDSGDIPMMRYGSTTISTSTLTSWVEGMVSIFIYDGTNWYRIYNDTNSTYSPQSLGFGLAKCTTAESTTAKVASLSSYALTKQGAVNVWFQYAVPANSTLNINSKGEKNICYNNSTTKIIAGIIKAGDIATFVYDGTQYQLVSILTKDAKAGGHHSHTASFSGTAAEHNHSIAALTTGGPSATVKVGSETHTHSIPALTFSGTAFSHSHTIPALGFTGTAASHTHSIPALTFSGTAASHNHSIPQLLFSGTAAGHTHTTSGSGTASASTSTTTVPTSGHTHAVTLSGSVTNQKLTLSATTSATGSSSTVQVSNKDHTHSVSVTGTAASTSITPVGTITTGSGTSVGNTGDKSLTPAGTISAGTGTSVGNTGNKSVTPAGTIAASTTGGTSITPKGTIAVIEGDSIGNTNEVTHTPAGSVAGSTSGQPSATTSVGSSAHTHSTSATNTGNKSVTPAGTVTVATV